MVDSLVRLSEDPTDPSGSFDDFEDNGGDGGSLIRAMTSDGIGKSDPMEPLRFAFAMADKSSLS